MAIKDKTVKLLVVCNPVSCPECKTWCEPVSTDGRRVVVRHGAHSKESRECVNFGKLYTFAQPSISSTEL